MGYAIIGLIAGTVSGLGMGGGTVLILILTLWGGLEQMTAQATNLVFFIPTALVATVLNFKRKNIRKEIVFPVGFFGVIGAMLGAYIATHMEVSLLRKLFGYFLLFVSVNEVYSFYKMYKKEKSSHTSSSKK